MSVLQKAKEYLQARLSIIPIIKGEKRPALSGWREYQMRLPTIQEIQKWFSYPKDIALIGGKVSGNLEIIDFDNHLDDIEEIFQQWKELVTNSMPEIFDKIYIQQTRNKGYHVIYRAQIEIPHNTKIASRKVKKDGEETVDTFIETRGESGYALIYPSDGYSVVQGSLTRLVPLQPEERDLLINACYTFNQIPSEPQIIKEQDYKTETNEGHPGDEFNKRGDITQALIDAGWTLVRIERGRVQLWRRPGKQHGWSATFDYIPDRFYVFSANAYPFEPDRAYDKFSVYTLLKHNGDFASAAKELAKLGYGSQNGKSHKNLMEVPLEAMIPSDLPPLTQAGNALRFKKLYEGKLKYNHTKKTWLIWDGKRWKEDDVEEVLQLGLAISEDIAKDEDKYIQKGVDPKKVLAWFKTSQSKHTILDSVDIAASDPVFRTVINDWDQDLYLVNFLNGTLDLRTMEFYPPRPQDMITKLIPFNYNPEASSPLWEEALNLYFNNNQELITFVQKLCGLSLCGAHLEEIIIFLYGLGSNGKTVFIRVIETLYGEYASKLPIEALINQRLTDDSKKAEIASLVGARFVSTTEIPKGKSLNEGTVKAITGGDAIRVRNLYQNFFTFKPTFTLWIFGNHKPEIIGVDTGIWRRMCMIPFENQIPPEKRKPQDQVLRELLQENEGILNWIVQGWKKYQKDGLQRPNIVTAATESYKEEQDPLADFINDCVIFGANHLTKSNEVYEAYLEWGNNRKEPRLLSRKKFYELIEERGIKSFKKQNVKYLIGIKLYNSHQDSIIIPPTVRDVQPESEDPYDEPF